MRTPAPFYKLWRKEKAIHAVTKASLRATQMHFALAVAQRERARDLAVAYLDQLSAAEARTAELRAQLSSLLDVRAGFGE